jgi:xyloglucan-specific exo-beta-1,4-glucanase
MRRRPTVAALATTGLFAAGVGVAVAQTPAAPLGTITGSAPTSVAADYAWGNVEIVGGGFVPGIVYNEGEQGLVYARTDIGGAYRLDQATGRWVPLLDHVGWDDWSYSGVLSLATDPVDPDNVYVLAGTYTNSWDPNDGAVLRSRDRGETWQRTVLPFQVGGNMPGRGMGERLMIDPNDHRVLYLGSEGGHGLWRSTDSGVTWSEVTSFPNPGNYVADPDDTGEYGTTNQGVLWTVFDESSGTAGSPTPTLYVGVADKENNVYRSTDAGATWQRVAGQPTGFLPHKAELADGQLYVTTSSTGGPYDGELGEVWRLDTASGTWTDISPVPSDSPDAHFGYSGLSVDRQDPDTLVVTSQMSWWPDNQVYRSTDRGETWKPIWEWAGYPARTKHYTLDVSGAPWLDFGSAGTAPEDSPKLGWMMESFEIDPFDSDAFLYGTGATVYGGENLTAWDTGGTVDISVRAQGIEETAIQDLVAPPGAVELVSGMYDIGGFVHHDITQVPAKFAYTQPYHSGVLSLDVAWKKPATMVRVGTGGDQYLGVSTSDGDSWWAGQQPSGVTGPGNVAMSADGATIVWSPAGTGVHRSTTLGSSWTASTGVPAGATVRSDKEDPQAFYAFSGGTFYTSRDGGASFTPSAATGLPAAGRHHVETVPGKAGHVWVAGGETDDVYGMWRSTDYGATFTPVAGVEEGDTIGFGKAADGHDHPAVYTSSKIDGVRGIFRSDDAGATWVRINDDAHQYAWTGAAITGDPDVYGRVYVGTNGRGVIVGEFDGLQPTPGPTPSATPTVSPDPSPSPSTTPDPSPSPSTSPTTPPAGSCAATYTVVGRWPGGFQGEATVRNTGAAPLSSWTLTWAFTGGETLVQGWGGTVSQTGTTATAAAPGWQTDLAPGASATVGFIGSGTPGPVTDLTANGEACTTT